MTSARSFDGYLIEKLADPAYAKVYIEIALELYKEDWDLGAFLLALREVGRAQGGQAAALGSRCSRFSR